jgi:hypothetical protein
MEVQLPVLKLPAPVFRIISGSGQSSKIFDTIRRKYVLLTPEEWVRQHLLHYLINEKKFPLSLIAVEKSVKVNGLPRRTDVLVYNSKLEKILLAECKAPSVKITQAVFDQAARYNMTLDVKCFVLTNGLETYCCTMDHELKKYVFLKEVPLFTEI